MCIRDRSYEDQEIFSIDEMVKFFTLEAVNKSGSVFNKEKLDWVNQQHMQAMSAEELGLRLKPYVESILGVDALPGDQSATLAGVAELQKDRVSTLKQMAEESHYFFRAPADYDPKAAAKQLTDASVEPLSAIRTKLADLGSWEAGAIDETIKATVDELGICLLYTSPSPRDATLSRMPSSA